MVIDEYARWTTEGKKKKEKKMKDNKGNPARKEAVNLILHKVSQKEGR